MGFENDGCAIDALKHHPMTQKAQACRNRSWSQVFSMILEQIRMFSWKAVSPLMVWLKGNVWEPLSCSQLVALFEHNPDSLKVVLRFWPDHVISSLISSLGYQSDE